MRDLAYKIRLMLLGIFISLSVGALAQVGGGSGISAEPPSSTPTFDTLTVTGEGLFNAVTSGATNSVEAASTGPSFALVETDAPVDEGYWKNFSTAGSLRFTTNTDVGVAVGTWLRVDRTGTTVDTINLTATTVQTNGSDATHETGTFTLTLDTGCTTSPSGTATYAKSGNVVVVDLPDISCTSNATNKVFTTDFPAAIQPSTPQFPLCAVFDNGLVAEVAACQVNAVGTMLLNRFTGLFTASGNSGIQSTTITYLLN